MSVLRFLTDLMKPEASGQIPLDFHPYGQLMYKRTEGGWFGTLEGIRPHNAVEICIRADPDDERPTAHTLELLREFITKLDPLMDDLFSHIHQNFLSGKWENSIEELREMYFLVAISLKRDANTYWVVLEPDVNVESIFEHFLRFTIVKNEITWSNLSS